jgi:hypothetical protein
VVVLVVESMALVVMVELQMVVTDLELEMVVEDHKQQEDVLVDPVPLTDLNTRVELVPLNLVVVVVDDIPVEVGLARLVVVVQPVNGLLVLAVFQI